MEQKNVEMIFIWAWSLLYYLGKRRNIDRFIDTNYLHFCDNLQC